MKTYVLRYLNMFNYNIIEKPSFEIDENNVSDIFKAVSILVPDTQKWILNIVFVGDGQMVELNSRYRWKDYTTDVLSFHYYDEFESIEESDTAWEIVLSESKIVSQWEEYGLWSEKEFYKLLIHSVLHILWYDHEDDKDYEIMKKYEDKIWKEIFGKIEKN